MSTASYRDAAANYYQDVPGQFAMTLRLPGAESLEDIIALLKRDIVRPLKRIYRGQVLLRGVIALTPSKGEDREKRWRHAHLTLQVPTCHPIQDPDQILTEIQGRSRKSSTALLKNGLEVSRIKDPVAWAKYMAQHLSPFSDDAEIWSSGNKPKSVHPGWVDH